jgi:hypothetical protein
MPNPDSAAPNPAAPARFDDRPLMALGIPAFGIRIPWLTGLYGPLTPAQPRWWLGQLLFVTLAATVWLGNRWLLFKQREHFDWFSQPQRKLLMLVTANERCRFVTGRALRRPAAGGRDFVVEVPMVAAVP